MLAKELRQRERIMKRLLVATLAVAFLSSTAWAGLAVTGPNQDPKGQPITDITGTGTMLRTGPVCAFNVAGIQSWDALGSPNNTIIILDAAACIGLPSGTPIEMNGIGWDVNLSAFGGSWLSELRVYFDDTLNPDFTGLFLRPGAGSNFPGTASFANPIIKLVDVAIPNIPLPNGLLRLDFHESFDDVANAVDGQWNSGVLLIQLTPEPATLSLLGLGAFALLRRRRA
jgi:hypothetical protein